jgi:hypothetical protein
MAKGIKLKPDQPKRFYVGMDGTGTIDTLAWGQLWHATFGWSNLLLELGKDPLDADHRVDSAHPKLPIRRLVRQQGSTGTTYADTCLLPEGVDKPVKGVFKGSGTDKLWPGADALGNLAEMNAACKFTQTFILNPRVDAATSALTDVGSAGAVASVVFISSHGFSTGDMFGDSHFVAGNDYIFELSKGLVAGQFSGPDWLLLSNCSTLDSISQPDWVKLMTGPTPLRGIVGFQNTCPGPDESVDIFSRMIQELANGKTFLQAWRLAVKSKTSKDFWVVLCHENAKGDTIADLNAGTVTAIPAAGSKIFAFDESKLAGVQVTDPPDPFDAFWSKGATAVTPANRSANKLSAGDDFTVTVRLPDPSRKPGIVPIQFADKAEISITLIYIRPNYEQDVDVNALFSVQSVVGGALRPTNPTVKLNNQRPAGFDKGPDSWVIVVSGQPTELVLKLKCSSLSTLHHHNVLLRLQVDIGGFRFYFARNGAIEVT